MSPTITQIISFASKEAVIPRDIFKAGTQRPQSQVIGGGVEEPEAKLWFLGKDHSHTRPPSTIAILMQMYASILQNGTRKQNLISRRFCRR